MKVEIEVPDFTRERGMRMIWDDGYEIDVRVDGTIILRANEAGLISLARLCLVLAQSSVPVGHHWHLDDMSAFEKGSPEITIVKM